MVVRAAVVEILAMRWAVVILIADTLQKSPISADQLAVRLRDWDKKKFTATGSSTGAAAAQLARPTDDIVWIGVSDEHRRTAILAAKQNATTQALDAVKAVPL